MQFCLEPITAWPLGKDLGRVLKLLQLAKYSLVVEPLNGMEPEKLEKIPPALVPLVGGAWHPHTGDSMWEWRAWRRALRRPGASIKDPLPWDNFFWGVASKVLARMDAIKRLFPNAIYAGHSPLNSGVWQGPYAWEVGSGYGIGGEAILNGAFRGLLVLDLFHLIEDKEGRQVVSMEGLPSFLRRLVNTRGNDIAAIHLHLGALQVLPFVCGVVPSHIRQSLKILSDVDRFKKGKLLLVPEFSPFPVYPLNMSLATSAFLARRIREVTESCL